MPDNALEDEEFLRKFHHALNNVRLLSATSLLPLLFYVEKLVLIELPCLG